VLFRSHFHRQGYKQTSRLHPGSEEAVAAGAYLGESLLTNCNFIGCSLSGALLRNSDLSGAELASADLSSAELRQCRLIEADLAYADLSGARLWRSDLSDAVLQDADLSDAQLDGIVITSSTDLTRVTWLPRDKRWSVWKWLHVRQPTMRDEGEAEDARDFAICEGLYRRIGRWYREAGDCDTSGRFFIREMECKRKQLPRWSLMRAVYHVLHFVSDYFENPWRVVVIGGLVILLFAFLHAGTGFFWAAGRDCPPGGQGIGGGITLNLSAADWPALKQALYFSAVTFTATGYGDYVPNPGLSQFLAAAESLIGVFLMAMFLVCLARKFGRA
jgi:hypothetical protein